MHHFIPSLYIWGGQFHNSLCLFLRHHPPIKISNVKCNEIIFLGINLLYRIITERYMEVKWVCDLVQFSVGNAQTPLMLIPGNNILIWFRIYNHQCPHRPFSSSTTQFSSKCLISLHTTYNSCGPYLGVLQQMGGCLPVSDWNENPWIGQRNNSSQNAYRQSVTTSLTLY